MQTEDDAADISAALASEPGSTYRLILSATGSLQVPETKVVPLSEVIEPDVSGGFATARCDA